MSFKTTVNLLSDSNALPVNCRIHGGELLPALSPLNCGGSVPGGVIFAGHAEGAGRFFICDGKSAYASDNGFDFIRLGDFAGDSPFLIEDYDGDTARAVLINGLSAFAHTGKSFKKFDYGANLCCGVMHCGRLFGVDGEDRLKLCWSGEGGVSDWEGGMYGSGNLRLDPERGEVLDILEYGEKLVAVRKFGLTVLNMFGAPENFCAEITDTDTDEIFKNTAKVAGGKLLFYTRSGLHYFNGSSIGEITHRYSHDIFLPERAAEFGGKYFLSCQSQSLNGGAVLCYDCSDGESYLIDCVAEGLCAAECVCAYGEGSAYAFEGGGEYSFTSGKINFGSGRAKTVTSLYIEGGEVDLEINNGKLTRRFSNVSGLIRPKLRGKSFTVKVKGKNAVFKLTATAEECNAI